jgi:hypothetical protein
MTGKGHAIRRTSNHERYASEFDRIFGAMPENVTDNTKNSFTGEACEAIITHIGRRQAQSKRPS